MEAVAIVGVVLMVALSMLSTVGPKRPTTWHTHAWRALAERRGGTYNTPKVGLTNPTSPDSVDVHVAQVVVHLDLAADELGQAANGVTRARANFALGAGPVFEMRPDGVLSGVDRSFDDDFAVRGEDPAAWPMGTQQLLSRKLRGARVWSDGSRVSLTMPGTVVDDVRLDAMLDVVASIASVGAIELQALAELPEATLMRSSNTWDKPSVPQLRITTAHGEATATLHWMKGGPHIWMTLPTTRDLPAFRVEVRNGAADGLPSGLLSEYTLRLLGELDGVLLLSEPGTLDVRWLGIPTPDGLMAGAKLLGELAGGTHHVGAFR